LLWLLAIQKVLIKVQCILKLVLEKFYRTMLLQICNDNKNVTKKLETNKSSKGYALGIKIVKQR